MLDFWRWAFSDLRDNTQRGVLAEFLVALALGHRDAEEGVGQLRRDDEIGPGVVMDEMGHTDPALALRVYRQSMRRGEDEKAALRALVEGGETA